MENNNQIELAKEFAKKKFAIAGIENHFLEVYQILRDEFHVDDPELLTGAILHDILEDTGTTYDELTKVFSGAVADLVGEVSHPKNYNFEQRIEYYEKLKRITPRAKMIKLADFTSHLRRMIGIYELGQQNLYPKFINNDKYIDEIRDFLESCFKSRAKEVVFELTNQLEKLIITKTNSR
jgi:(p)ppGpp synthase/HD superfamily hydrolase